jgi:ABC-type phosphate transport system substrate-binding protein
MYRLIQTLLAWLLLGLPLAATPQTAAPTTLQPVVIAHSAVGPLDASTLQRLYTGRAIEVDGQPVTVINAPPGSALRVRFLQQVLGQDDARYIAYWIVRRHVGKGAPPLELKTATEVIDFVRQTPGAIGYIAATDLRPGLNVVFRP